MQQRILKVSKVAPEIARTEFENMSDETFEMFFAEIERDYNDKIEAEKKAEEERIAKEKAEAEERERIRKENERLKAKAEAEEKAHKEAEAKVIAEQKAKEASEKKAKNAPDKTKLIELASQIDNLNMPEIKGEEAQKILSDVKILLSKVSVFIREKSNLI